MKILSTFSFLMTTFLFVQPYAIPNNGGIVRNAIKSLENPLSKLTRTLEMAEEILVNPLQNPKHVMDRSKRQVDGADLEAFQGTKQEDGFEGDDIVDHIIDGVVESFTPVLKSISPAFGSLLRPAISRVGGTLVNGAFEIAQDLLSEWNVLNSKTDSSFEAYPVYIPNKGSFILLTKVGLPENEKLDTTNYPKSITKRQSRNVDITKNNHKFGHPINNVGVDGTSFTGANYSIVKEEIPFNEITQYSLKNSTKENSDLGTRKNVGHDHFLSNKFHNDTGKEIVTNISLATSSLINKTNVEIDSISQKNKIDDTNLNVIETENVSFQKNTTLIPESPSIEPREGYIDEQIMEHRSSNYSNIMKIPEQSRVNIKNFTTEKPLFNIVNTTEKYSTKKEEITFSTTSTDLFDVVKQTEEKESKSIYLGGVHLIPLPDDIVFGDNTSVSDKNAVQKAIQDIVESQNIVKRVRKKLILILVKKMEEATAGLRKRIEYHD